MLRRLELHHVGPATRIGPIDLAERVNVFTGDNGLGKTLFLDVAWWALTGTWLGRPAWSQPPGYAPSGVSPPHGRVPRIVAEVESKTKEAEVEGHYDFTSQQWATGRGRPPMPGLVLYFRVDGRFSLWDPAQHYWRRNKALGIDDPSRPDALHFAPGEAWDTIKSPDGRTICRGLIEDWVTWQQTKSAEFDFLSQVLATLSPNPNERLVPGPPMRVWLDDIRLYPTLDLPYGRTPVTLASAGVQRIVLLSYLLVWVWRGHQEAAALLGQAPERRIVVLFDEPETHLHPEWQRRLIPALLRAIGALRTDLSLQLLVSTHAPLVLASLEPEFDPRRDQLFHFALDTTTREAILEPMGFAKRGDAVNWLVSDVFGLRQARSVQAEEAIEAAERFMRGEADGNPPGLQTSDDIDARLKQFLGDRDPFWPRWLVRTGQV